MKTKNRKPFRKPRIPLTHRTLARLSEIHPGAAVTDLVKRSGLPYGLVYNIVHGRVKSISDRHYRMLYREAPPHREPEKVDGAEFRSMVNLWLFLNDHVTRSDLYREFYGDAHPRKPDLRIFTGDIRTVNYGLDRMMRRKFADAGIDAQTLGQWLEEFDRRPADRWVPYKEIRPVLHFLQETLGMHPTSVLNQSVVRYESGMLQRVPRRVYDSALMLKGRVEKALEKGGPREMAALKEEISGGKSGYTLYADIEDELRFLRRHAGKSAAGYLGRGVWTYKTGAARRIADWRARKIMADCDDFIRRTPGLPLSCLPPSHQRKHIGGLMYVLVARAEQLMARQESTLFEKRVLSPVRAKDEYKSPAHGFTSFDMASSTLGMRKKAFDLMVAKNCEIFRSVGIYSKRWLLSDLYLRELAENEHFDLISAIYELMAKRLGRTPEPLACVN